MEQYYKTNLHGKDGGSKFRARFGVEREGVSLLADGSYTVGSELKDGYPEFNYGILKRLGWDKDLTETERAAIQKIGSANPTTVCGTRALQASTPPVWRHDTVHH